MSAAKVQKRPSSGVIDLTSPNKANAPKLKTPTASGTPTSLPPGDSPERASKRPRLSQENEGLAPPALGQVGRGMSGGWGGAVWVTDRVAELEGLYKECIVASTLLLQYRAYSQKLGLDIRRIPRHLSQRLETAWARYESLRSHIESYLLHCAQAASSPSSSIPLPSSLVPGLPPLPSTPSTPSTAINLLEISPHPGRSGPVSLDRLLAADPAKGLVGYEKGQVVFPGVPSDIAMPIPLPDESESKVEPDSSALGGSEIMPISLPGVDYQADAGAGLGLGDMGGMELDSLGMDELSALINGDGGLPGDGALGELGQGSGGGVMGGQEQAGGMRLDESKLLESLNEYAQAQNAMLVEPAVPAPQHPPIAPRANDSIDPKLSNISPLPPPTSSQQPQYQQNQPQPFALPAQQPPAPAQPFDFDFSTIEGADGLDPLDGLADIDFNELAGMFGGSGRTTRVQSPAGGAGAAVPPAQSQGQAQAPELGLALSNLYPSAGASAAPLQAAAFDASLGGIDLDDFDFTGGDGEGGMPGVDGDEFESMFAEFK